MDNAPDINATAVYTRRPLSLKTTVITAGLIVFGAWFLTQGLTAYGHAPDSQPGLQFRAVKSILAGGVFFALGLFLAYCAIAGVLRDLPRLTLSKDQLEFHAVLRIFTAKWTALGPFVLNPKGTFLRGSVASADLLNGKKVLKPIIIPAMSGDMAALADNLNHRIAAAQGGDFAKLSTVIAAVQAKDKANDDRNRRVLARARCRTLWLVVLCFGLVTGGSVARIHMGLPVKPYASYIVFGSFVIALLASYLIAKKKYPDLPKG